MATTLTVQEVVSGKTYDLTIAETGVSRDEEVTTTAALFGFIDEKVRNDALLRDDQAEKLRLRLAGDTETDQIGQAVAVGKRIRDIGDEFVEILRRDTEMESIVNSYVVDTDGNETPEAAYTHFSQVVRGVFDCGEDGVARTINLGRIAGVFSYCYRLVTAAAQRYRDMETVLVLFRNLLGYLMRFFAEAGFYRWLRTIGGWGQLLVQTYDWVSRSTPRTLIATAVLITVAGVLVYNALM